MNFTKKIRCINLYFRETNKNTEKDKRALERE